MTELLKFWLAKQIAELLPAIIFGCVLFVLFMIPLLIDKIKEWRKRK